MQRITTHTFSYAPQHPRRVLIVRIATPSNRRVGGRHKGITTDRQNVHVNAISLHPFFRNTRSIRDNRHGQTQFVRGLTQFPQQSGMQKWFATGKIDFFRPGLLQEAQSCLRLWESQVMRVFLRVETKLTRVIATTGNKVIDGLDGGFRFVFNR